MVAVYCHFKSECWAFQTETDRLGWWFPGNELALNRLGISRSYRRLMRRLCCIDAISGSRDIYIEHMSGHRQYVEVWGWYFSLPPFFVYGVDGFYVCLSEWISPNGWEVQISILDWSPFLWPGALNWSLGVVFLFGHSPKGLFFYFLFWF